MEEKFPKPPQHEFFHEKKGTMKKHTFTEKFGYVDAILIAWGLTVGLMYCGMLMTNPERSQLKEVADYKEKDGKKSSTLGIFYLVASIFVGIFITLQLRFAWELYASSKLGTNKSMPLLRICITCGVLLLTVDFIGMMLGYPDSEILVFEITLATIVEYVLAIVIVFDLLLKRNESYKEEKGIMEQEANALELASAYKIETV